MAAEERLLRRFWIIALCALVALAGVGIIWWVCRPPEIQRNHLAISQAMRMIMENIEPEVHRNQGFFWTGDLATLADSGAIPRALADADAAPLRPRAGGPVPYHGYLVVAMAIDGRDGSPFREHADSVGRKVQNARTFGFCAYPAIYGRTGKMTVLVNEYGALFKRDTRGVPLTKWPSDEDLTREFARACQFGSNPQWPD